MSSKDLTSNIRMNLTYGLPGGLDPPEVLTDWEQSHLHLDCPEPRLLEGLGLRSTGGYTLLHVDGAGVVMVVSEKKFQILIKSFNV